MQYVIDVLSPSLLSDAHPFHHLLFVWLVDWLVGYLSINKQLFPLFFFSSLSLSLVTLLGAHALGNVHIDVSGYGIVADSTNTDVSSLASFNAWSSTPARFDNNFFVEVVKTWTMSQPNGPTTNLWSKGPLFRLVMLNVDMALAYKFSGGDDANPSNNGVGIVGEKCRPAPFGCIAGGRTTSLEPSPTYELSKMYANSNDAFLAAFSKVRFRMRCQS
jgi:hypothetical protein